jgi:Zn ribbon nucleic-acid-binding protein
MNFIRRPNLAGVKCNECDACNRMSVLAHEPTTARCNECGFEGEIIELTTDGHHKADRLSALGMVVVLVK